MRKISVVIPTFNHSAYVLEAINSVKANKDIEVEIILVNDGSPDDSHELLKDLPGIRYYLTENRGAHSALNFGIEQSSHDYIAILNDDDLYKPNHLIGSLLELESTGADIVISKFEPFGKGDFLEQIRRHAIVSDQRIIQYGLLKTLLQINWAVSSSAFCFKKKVFESNGGFSELSMCHDYEFLLSALVKCSATIFYSNRTDWLYRCHTENSSHKVNIEERRAQWYTATFISYDSIPQHIQEYLREIASEHLGIDSDLFNNIVDSLNSMDRSEMDLGLAKIRKLLVTSK